MAVAVETEPSLSFGIPEKLFKNTNLGLGIMSGTPWDIHPDGKRFLMMKPAAASGGKINVVVNWFEELRQRMSMK